MLAASLSIGTPNGTTMPDEDAVRYAAKALYRELEWDRVTSRIEKRYIKIDKYPELAYIGVVARLATEKRISYTWTF